MSSDLVQRVRYQEGQILGVDDLEQEQRSRLEAGRRHNIAHHNWGIVQGLELGLGEIYAPDGSVKARRIIVNPGLAVDGFGRELIMHEPLAIDQADLDEIASEYIDVWLMYMRLPLSSPRPGRYECGPEHHNQWREEAWLQLSPGKAGVKINPREPLLVASADLGFSAIQAPPDDPDRAWPVYLGRIQVSAGGPTAVDLSSRPYATLMGELISAPSGLARMQVGSELAGDQRRFALGVHKKMDETGDDAEADSETGDDEAAGSGPKVISDILTINNQGNLTVYTDTTITKEDLTIAQSLKRDQTFRRPGSCEDELLAGGRLLPRIEFEPLKATPVEAAEWQIYHTIVKEEEKPPVDQLRFEIAHPGEQADPARNQFAVGIGDPFKACFTVAADCSVQVDGNLKINGQVTEGPIDLDLTDQRLLIALLYLWFNGLTTASETQLEFLKTLLE